MTHAVELFFDDDADVRVRSLWQAIGDAGLSRSMLMPGYRPHVSLVVADSCPLDRCRSMLMEAFDNQPQFPLSFSRLDAFRTSEGVVFLSPDPNEHLMRIQAAFHKRYRVIARDPNPFYHPTAWIPHCTLAFGISPSRIDDILAFRGQFPLPLRAIVCEVGSTTADETGADLHSSVRLSRVC